MKKIISVTVIASALVLSPVSVRASSIKISETYSTKIVSIDDDGDSSTPKISEGQFSATSTLNVSVPLTGVDISTFNEGTSIDFQFGGTSIFGDDGAQVLSNDPHYTVGKRSVTFVKHREPDNFSSPIVFRLTASWTPSTLTMVATSAGGLDIFDAVGKFSPLEEEPSPRHLKNEPVEASIVVGDMAVATRLIYVNGTTSTKIKVVGGSDPDVDPGTEITLNSGQITGQADYTAPTLVILSPAANKRYSNDNTAITITGKAADTAAIASFSTRWNDSGFSEPTPFEEGSNNWSTEQTLIPGTNTIWAFSTDASGNNSRTNSRSFFYVVPSTLTLATNGSGSITGQRNGASLNIGQGYRIAAKPTKGSGQIFCFWNYASDNLATNLYDANLNFLMGPNLTLTANFAANPFPAAKGIYSGLFFDIENGVATNSAGFLTLTLTASGSFTGKILLGKDTYPISQLFHFDLDHMAVSFINVKRPGKPPLVCRLQLDLSTSQLTGSILQFDHYDPDLAVDVFVVSQLSAQLCNYQSNNPAPGLFNLATPVIGEDPSTAPGGSAFGSAVVDRRGNVKLILNLPDAVPTLTFGSCLAADGTFPFFSSFGGKGVVLGWLTFDSSGDLTMVSGQNINWIKSPSRTPYYPDGFGVSFSASGARYIAPTAGINVVDWTEGTVAFGNGNLDSPIFDDVTFANNVFTPAISENKITLKFLPATGLVSGSFVPVPGKKPVLFQGALVPGTGNSFGFFKGTNQTGSMFLGTAAVVDASHAASP